MSLERRKTREVTVGSLKIGSEHPVVVQSMTNTDTRDVESTVAQIEELVVGGCELVRVAVLDEQAAWAISRIKEQVSVPLIADIHFDHRLAIKSLEAGVDALRINPGNIGGASNVDKVVDAAKAHNAAIRVGVNSGSVEKALLDKFGGPTPEAMVESAMHHVAMLEKREFYNTKISLKSSSVLHTIDSYRLLAGRCDYPLHIGVTEAGTLLRGAIKSSVGLGVLLWQGIGDTLRVSLTDDPVQEMTVAWELLRALGLRNRGPEIISCPTCGRTEIGLINLVEVVEKRLEGVVDPIKVAVMGCVVNGPGEAREADIGIAGGRDKGIIFRKGKVIRTVKGGANLLNAFMEELDNFLIERNKG
ncbi:flavodoxin-dependent (E)-4-hydroxy-3-methylbut-2-enyl-diphosphate synthase [Halodesulfovibrio sp. MK-HDV]|jgi:(E)-4-hydroxy-3-methylbut-2-enyl-diphosphate synthase|uniref:flavodoxin-dependent (E)-4-hydroxy-3-methylbut-2-enyl-diphosphate synthase n=1 Tax=unclassified Halodesulfovibrio TaxID=2644657 RepID=UPI001367B30A|nr:flavodoxin-dependent (E)-4-hydroxy-3-methylbut-2-enyl-diphosphate synthase [Halodesulfovibrio sp. MK-HDV]KAF1074589.1 4-hydroxy-3-methylbut-2-en-1-yl diphosphate synthase (flavodoxin) [Halodesulfovibrio sp. MK-HDV]